MKCFLKIFGSAALAAVIGFTMIACEEGDGTTSGGDPIAVTGVTLAPTTLNLTVGGSTGTLTPTVAPANAANKAVTWSTSNAAVATVSGGTVTAVGAGTATITVTTTDGSFTAVCAVTVTSGGNPNAKTVSVGAQVGTLVAGISGTVTYPVTTVNIADGTYPVTVANRPTGITIGNSGNITISDNAGTLTLVGSTSTAAMTINTLTLTLDGATSGTFSITILGKTVSVGAQVGTLYDGTAGTVTYPVTTENIANGTYSATVANRPTGVTVSGQVTISGNAGTLTLAGNTSTAAGTTDTLTLTLNGATSGTFSIVITPHDHTYSTTWSSNTEQHWKECTVAGCNAKTETDNHLLTDGICSICGYEPPFPMQMVSISAGTLTWPNATITLSAFKMGKYQVTQEQYEAVMGTNPSYFSSNPAAGEIQARRPVERVSWYDAIEFCNALSIREELTPYYTIDKDNPDPNNNNWYDDMKWLITTNESANGYRLPTEAQWEYACRAGSTTNWYFGNDESELANYAWYSANSNDRTHQVGLKLPNAFGLYDMHGNVFEWCWDWFGNYPTSNQTDYTGAVSGSNRVQRGGYFNTSAVYTRSSVRDSYALYVRSISLGFRVVRP